MSSMKEKTIGSKEPSKGYEVGKGGKPGKANLPKKEEKWKNNQTNPRNKPKDGREIIIR